MNDIRYQLLYSLYRDGNEPAATELLTTQCDVKVLHQLWRRDHDPLIGELLARSIDLLYLILTDDVTLLLLRCPTLQEARALMPIAIHFGYPIINGVKDSELTIRSIFFELEPSNFTKCMNSLYGDQLYTD